MQTFILTLHVLFGIFLIILVLLQQGKGATLGAAFGSGSSNTMFGSAGAAPFLMKLSILFAILFGVTSITLTRVAAYHQHHLATLPMPTQSNPVVVPPKGNVDMTPAKESSNKSSGKKSNSPHPSSSPSSK